MICNTFPLKIFVLYRSTAIFNFDLYLVATRIIPNGKDFRDRSFRMGCALPNQPNICGQNACYHERYRTFDGSCNSKESPMKVFFLNLSSYT